MPAEWPALRYDAWSATCDTLHAHTQVLGKLAAALAIRLDGLVISRPTATSFSSAANSVMVDRPGCSLQPHELAEPGSSSCRAVNQPHGFQPSRVP